MRLPCSNGDYPDAAPGFGCAATAGTCATTRSSWTFSQALEGEILGSGQETFAVRSASVTDFARFKWAAFWVELDKGYPDVTGVDLWFYSTTTYAASQRNLSVWLSPVVRFTASRAVQCVSGLTPSVFAPARTRVNCTQTPSFTKFVFVQRPLSSGANGAESIYIYEMRVLRSGGQQSRWGPLQPGAAYQECIRSLSGARSWS